jgi:hypothetical protein
MHSLPLLGRKGQVGITGLKIRYVVGMILENASLSLGIQLNNSLTNSKISHSGKFDFFLGRSPNPWNDGPVQQRNRLLHQQRHPRSQNTIGLPLPEMGKKLYGCIGHGRSLPPEQCLLLRHFDSAAGERSLWRAATSALVLEKHVERLVRKLMSAKLKVIARKEKFRYPQGILNLLKGLQPVVQAFVESFPQLGFLYGKLQHLYAEPKFVDYIMLQSHKDLGQLRRRE